MTNIRYVLALGAMALMALSHTASAQQVGPYTGTPEDGSSISFTIGTDSATGAMQVTAAGISFTDTCNPGAFSYSTGWGLGGDGTDLSGNKGTYTTSFGYLYESATLVFSGSTLKGTVVNATPTLVAPASGSGKPIRAAYCTSKRQTYTATLQETASSQAAARPHAVFYGDKVARH